MTKSIVIGAWLTAAMLSAQTGTVSLVQVDVNIQVLSQTVIQSKYRVKLPKGISAGSAVVENKSSGTMYIGQGSIVKALRDKGYPALDRIDARAIIFSRQNSGPLGFIKNELPFAQKLMNDIEGLIVVKALGVSTGVGLAIAGTSALLNAVTPDILAQIQQFEQVYDADGLQSLLKLSPGDSAVGTVIFDGPPVFTTTAGHSFEIPVPVVNVTQ